MTNQPQPQKIFKFIQEEELRQQTNRWVAIRSGKMVAANVELNKLFIPELKGCFFVFISKGWFHRLRIPKE